MLSNQSTVSHQMTFVTERKKSGSLPLNYKLVPLAAAEIAGSLNLRGRVVTAINLRHRLQIPALTEGMKTMYIVVTHKDELYSLIVDSVGEVLSLPDKDFEKTPTTLDPSWRDLSLGIYRQKNKLLVILDVPKMLESLNVRDSNAA